MANNKIDCDKKCPWELEAEQHKKDLVEESFALTLLKETSKQTKRLFITILVILVCWFSTIAGFVWYLDQYDFTSTTEVSQDGECYNQYVGGNLNGAKDN